jgi:hypothetical protein
MKIDKMALIGAIIISAILVCLYLIFSVLPAYNAMTNTDGLQGVINGNDNSPLSQMTLFVGATVSIGGFLISTFLFYFVIAEIRKRKK